MDGTMENNKNEAPTTNDEVRIITDVYETFPPFSLSHTHSIYTPLGPPPTRCDVRVCCCPNLKRNDDTVALSYAKPYICTYIHIFSSHINAFALLSSTDV
jgi:hypothetical protein